MKRYLDSLPFSVWVFRKQYSEICWQLSFSRKNYSICFVYMCSQFWRSLGKAQSIVDLIFFRSDQWSRSLLIWSRSLFSNHWSDLVIWSEHSDLDQIRSENLEKTTFWLFWDFPTQKNIFFANSGNSFDSQLSSNYGFKARRI